MIADLPLEQRISSFEKQYEEKTDFPNQTELVELATIQEAADKASELSRTPDSPGKRRKRRNVIQRFRDETIISGIFVSYM